MVSILAPIGIFIGKVVLQDILTDEVEDRVEKEVEDCIEKEVEDNISAAEDEEIEKPLRQHWKECYTTFVINICLLALAAVVVPWFATPETSHYIIYSVYFSIVIHSFFKWARRGWKFLKFVALYQCSLKKKVRSVVRQKIESNLPEIRLSIESSSTFWRRLFVSDEEIFIKAHDKLLKSEEYIIDRLYETALTKAFVYGTKIVLASVFYILVFRMFVAPQIENATGLSYIDSAIYPFMASINYFFGFDFLTLSIIGTFFRS